MPMTLKEVVSDESENPKDYCFSHGSHIMSDLYKDRLKQNADLMSGHLGCKSRTAKGYAFIITMFQHLLDEFPELEEKRHHLGVFQCLSLLTMVC